MAGKRKSMEQIRNILLQRAKGSSIRKIAKQTGTSRNTVRAYLRQISSANYSLEEVVSLSDEELGQLFFEQSTPEVPDQRFANLTKRFPYYAEELKKRHVTRQILWEEYRQEFPSGYGYTRFCYHLNAYIGHKDVTAIFHHKPGEKMEIDFAGDTISYIDRQTGEVVHCPVLITVLPFSSYMYAEALASQKQEQVVKGLNNAFSYLGGVPGCVICDNMKPAVKKADRYEPSFTELIDQLSLHYQTTFMATRVRKPRDKATVESSVRITYQRVYAKIRNLKAYSLQERNEQIRQALQELNERHFKNRDYSRSDLFTQYEQPCLKALPPSEIEVKNTVSAKVQRNYHIILGQDRHQYSVPCQYAGQQVKVVYTGDVVEIYCNHKRIALHKRNYRKHAYSTLAEHMPENHRAIMAQKGWDADYFTRQGRLIGPAAEKAIKQILQSKAFPEQTYNSCLGILRLAGKHGKDRLENACTLMLDGPRVNYTILKNILTNHMDKQRQNNNEKDFKTPAHENIRGPQQLLF